MNKHEKTSLNPNRDPRSHAKLLMLLQPIDTLLAGDDDEEEKEERDPT